MVLCNAVIVLTIGASNASGNDAGAPPSFRAEAGIAGELNAFHIDDRGIGPVVALYFDPVPVEDAPPDQAPFLAHASSAEIAIQLSNGSGRPVSDEVGDHSGWGLGWSGHLRFACDTLPLTVSVPFSSLRFHWRADDESLALVRYHTIGARAGLFVRPDIEVALGFAYMQPDFFYKVGGVDYNYLAWDIYSVDLTAKAVLQLPSGHWLAAEPAVVLFIDHKGHKLFGGALRGSFYLWPNLGVGPRLSFSSYHGEDDAWSANLKVMGVKELGVQATVNGGARWGVVAHASHQIPNEPEADSRTMLGFDFRVRW